MIVTFYSFKGGVGRSMAMVNIGEILADWGYRVILCDWDLEAPGLERYVVDGRKSGGPPAELAGWLARPGLVDLLQEYKETLAKPPALSEPEQTPPEVPPTHQQVGNVILRRPSTYAVATNPERRRQGSLSLLTAGRREGEHYQTYAEAVRAFDWNEFYESWAGDAYIEFLRLDLAGDPQLGRPGAADIVLIDSRTGVTEQGGVCTHHLADLVVLLSAANDLNLDGAIWMARTLSDPRLVDVRGGRPLQILPTPSRIEQTAQKEELVTFRRRFRREFRRYVPAAVGRPEDFALRAEIPYMPFYSFTERVVAREPESQREQKLYAAYSALAEGIVRSGAASGLLPEVNPRGRVVRTTLPSFAESAERPKGLIQLGYAHADRPMAEIVAQGMSAAGVQVWADFLPLQQQPGTSRQDGVLRTIEVCAGYVLLLGPGGIPPALRSEIGYVLNRQARQPDFRIVPVLLPGADVQSLGPLADLYAVQLPSGLSPGSSEWTELFASLVAEIGAQGADMPPIVDEGVPPYRGLRSFEEPEAPFFFGRAEEVQELMGRLGSARAGGIRWVQVEGPSGMGKSSFVLAGLVPAVRRGWLPGTGKSWIVATCRPGSDPIASLAAAFETPAGVAPSERQARLTDSERGLCDLVRAATPGGECFLLVVDSLEELLFLDDLGKQAQLDALLATSLEDPDLPFYLVTTLRSDAFDQFQELPRLGGMLRRGAVRHQLLPLSETALREAMTGPARLAGLAFESGLAERILRDLRLGQPSPALLELLLSRLWESRSGNLLTHEAYDRLGGIDGVLAESAERFFAGLPKADQEQARALLLQLVTAEGSRRSVRYDDAVGEIGEGPGTEEVLRKLAAAQIVTLTGDRVKLSHDALISWPRFARWLAADRDTLERREELESAALAWTNAGAHPDGLPSGPQLNYWKPTLARSKEAIQYLEAAREREVRLRRMRRIALVASLLIVAVVVAFQLWNGRQADRSRDFARRALEMLARPTSSLQYAIEAGQAADTLAAKSALREAIRS
ncbi:MAG TPA: AAA family ATPase, partial [Thermoanaerobaculia bacterium]|nr:AAA family ATPase [Thermoanaerobaculia bacterium]